MTDSAYTLESLTLSAFRAYLEPRTFEFRKKSSLAIFAPNGSGKSSIVDALEFLLSKDGTLERLGLRTIDNNAGVAALAHNLAAEKGVPPLVRVRLKCGDNTLEGTREAAGVSRTRPAVADAVQAGLTVDPLVRGYALRQFVEKQTAAERYENVARWLQLGPYVEVQRNLRALRQRTKAAAEDKSAFVRVDVHLAKKTSNSLKKWSEASVLEYANRALALLDKGLSLRSLGREDPAFIAVQARAKAEQEQLGLEGLRQVRRAAAALYEENPDSEEDGTVAAGSLVDFPAAVEAQVDAVAAEGIAKTAAANAVFAELWRAAEPLFAEGQPKLETCPICTTPIAASAARSVDGVCQHIAASQAGLAEYSNSKKTLDNAKSAVARTHAQLVGALERLGPLLPAAHAELKVELAGFLEATRLWSGGAVPDAAKLKADLRDLVKAVDASVAEIEAKQAENSYAKTLAKLEELLELAEERESAARACAELGTLTTGLNTQAAFISGAIRKEVQALLDTLEVPINQIYRQIQGAGAAPIRLELPAEEDTNQQRLNLVIDFAANRTRVQPGGFLSDSQIHSLALALRLAAIKRFNTAAPIIALDEIVTSYDADHRRRIAALLANEFSDFQLIITTHDERFFAFLKDQLGDRHCDFTRIIRLDPDFGPRFVNQKVTDATIEARWHRGESAANEMRQAQEEWLLRLCRDFEVNIRIRSVERAYSYERGELASALAAFLRDQKLTAPVVPGVNNRFLTSLQKGDVENFGSHFQDGPYGDGSTGDERARWAEFTFFREKFVCPKCGNSRFKRPVGMARPVCAKEGCEAQFELGGRAASAV